MRIYRSLTLSLILLWSASDGFAQSVETYIIQINISDSTQRINLGNHNLSADQISVLEHQSRTTVQSFVRDLSTRLQVEDAHLIVRSKVLRSQPAVLIEADSKGLELLIELEREGRIAYIQPNVLFSPASSFSTANSLSLTNPHLADFDADLAWNLGYEGQGNCIAILDSGVHLEHPVLKDRIIDDACFSTGGNLFRSLCIEDEQGNVTAQACTIDEACSHGTFMASIAAGEAWVSDSGLSFEGGVAKGAGILAYQVFSELIHSSCPRGERCYSASALDIISSIEDILIKQSTGYYGGQCSNIIVNMSLAGSGFNTEARCNAEHQGMAHWVQMLREAGIKIVASAGNVNENQAIGVPACIEGVLSASAATIENNQIAFHENSSSAPFANLFAPGVGLIGAINEVPSPFSLLSDADGSSGAAAALSGFLGVAAGFIPEDRLSAAPELCEYLKDKDSALVGVRPNTNYESCFPRFSERLFENVTTAQEDAAIPGLEVTSLTHFPNPFSQSTTFEMVLSQDTPGVSYVVYDILGKKVMASELGILQAGVHRFHVDAADWASGQYILEVSTPRTRFSRLLTLAR